MAKNAAKNPLRNKETMMDFLSSLLDKFRGRPQDLTGGGMAQQAGNILADRGYQLYSQETQALGEQPMPYEQWKPCECRGNLSNRCNSSQSITRVKPSWQGKRM